MRLSQLPRKEYRQLISQLTVSRHLLFFTVLLTGSTPIFRAVFLVEMEGFEGKSPAKSGVVETFPECTGHLIAT